MGYGQIIGGGTLGLYTVKLDFGVATRDAWLAAIDGWISDLNVSIANAEAAMVASRDRAAEAEAVLQGLIVDLASASNEGVAELQAKIDVATQRFAQAQAAADAARIPRDLMIAERKTLATRKGMLQSAVVERTLQAWCVDFTESASGYVATIEVPGEDQAVLIAAGGRTPNLSADGYLWARELMTPEQAFFNAAILPGWQKWKPTYRKGTLIAVDQDANLATVSLDPASSSAQQLPINQASILSNVPVTYMDCHAEVFEPGDRVVVEFASQSWDSPRVIGFVDNPRPCRRIRVRFAINGAVMFDEEYFPGDTVPGYTAPGSIAGTNDLGSSVDRPFIGWSNGTNTPAHPEFVAELPTTSYYINASYAVIPIREYWAMEISHEGNEHYFNTRSEGDFTIVEGFVRSTYSGVVSGPSEPPVTIIPGADDIATQVIGAPTVETGPWSTDWVMWHSETFGPLETPTYPTTPPPTQPVGTSGPSVSDFVPSTYTYDRTISGGWTATYTYPVNTSSKTFSIHYVSAISAAPP